MPTTPPAVTALPTPPSRSDPANFPTRGDAFLTALPVFQTQNNAVATNVFNNAVEGAASAVAALASQGAAAGSAGAAAGSAGAAANSAAASATATAAAAWVSAAPYAIGAAAWSPLTGLVYRRKVAGAGTVDPSLDPTNWRLAATVDLQMVTVTGTSFAAQINGRHVLTNAAKTTLVLPSTPTLGEVVGLLVANGRMDNEVDPGGNRISSFPPGEKLTVNSANATLAMIFSGAGAGWVPYKFDAAAMPGAPAMVVASGTGFALALPDPKQPLAFLAQSASRRKWDQLYDMLQAQCRPALQPMPARVRPHTNTGTQIYVDPTVVGPGTGTLGDPYKSLVTAVSAVASNQSVLIKAGTTAAPTSGALFTNASGASATAAIVIGVYQPATGARVFNSVGAATIDCAGTANNAFYLDNRAFICFDGIKFINKPAGAGSYVNFVGTSGNNQFLNCEITGSLWGGVGFAGSVGNDIAEGCVVSGCQTNGIAFTCVGANYTFTANYNTVSSSTDDGGIKIFQASGTCSGTIAGNAITGPGAYGILVQTVECNVKIIGNFATKTINGIALQDAGTVSGNYDGTIIENNTVISCGEAAIHHAGVAGNWLIQANRLYKSGSYDNGLTHGTAAKYGRGIELWGLPAVEARSTRRGTVRYNVCAGAYNFQDNGSEGVGIGCDNNSQGITIYGNICIDNEGAGLQVFDARDHIFAGNLVINSLWQPVNRNLNWTGNMRGAVHLNDCSNVIVTNNTIVAFGGVHQFNGIESQTGFSKPGNVFANNLIIGVRNIGIVRDATAGNSIEFDNIIEGVPVAVANTALTPIANGVGTLLVAAGVSGVEGAFYTPREGGICDGTGSVAAARFLSLCGVPLGANTPIGAMHP